MKIDDGSINGLIRVKFLAHFANDPVIPVRVILDETDIRQLLAWFAREKPQMVREAMKEPITEDNWNPEVHGYCGDLERVNARIKKAIETIEMQIGCSNMLYDDDEGGYEGEAYRQLRAECAKAIVLLKGEGFAV